MTLLLNLTNLLCQNGAHEDSLVESIPLLTLNSSIMSCELVAPA